MRSSLLISRLHFVFDLHVSKRVAFRPLARADAFPFFQATQHPDFNRYLLWHAPKTEAEFLPRIDRLLRETMMNQAVVLSICDRNTGTWLGTAVIKPLRNGLEVGLLIHPSRWNTSTVFAAGQGVVEILLRRLPETEIYMRVRRGNVKMEKIARKFCFEPIAEEALPHVDGSSHPVDVYRLNKEKWTEYNGLDGY